MNLLPMTFILAINVGFMEYHDPRHIAFLILMLCPCICIYYGIKNGWSKWENALLPITSFNLAFLLAFIEPSAMPLNILSLGGPRFVVLGLWSAFDLYLVASWFGSLADQAGRKKSFEDFRRYSTYYQLSSVLAGVLMLLGLLLGVAGIAGRDIIDWLFLGLGLLMASFAMLNLVVWGSNLDEGRFFGNEELATRGFLHSMFGLDEYEVEVRRYIVNCPLCGSDEIVAKLYSKKEGLFCKDCFAQWDIRLDLLGFMWGELKVAAKDGTGQALLGKRMKGYELRKMAIEVQSRRHKLQKPLQEREEPKPHKGLLQDIFGREKTERNVRKFFVNCPLCGSQDIEINLGFVRRDTLTCRNCRGKWHIYINYSHLQWAELEVSPNGHVEKDLVGKRIDSIELLKTALERRKRAHSN